MVFASCAGVCIASPLLPDGTCVRSINNYVSANQMRNVNHGGLMGAAVSVGAIRVQSCGSKHNVSDDFSRSYTKATEW